MNRLRNLGATLGIMESPEKAAYRAKYVDIASKLFAHMKGNLPLTDEEYKQLNRVYERMDDHLYPRRNGFSGPTIPMFKADIKKKELS